MSIHVQQPRGLDFGGKVLAWGAKAKAKTFMRCPRGSSRPRPGLEDNKTADYIKVVEDTPILSAAEMWAQKSSFQRYILYGDIGRGSPQRER